MTAPRDITDLYLAPLALELDDRLEQLAGLSVDDLLFKVALDTGREPRTNDEHREGLLRVITDGLDLHGWTVRLTPRGVRLEHGDHFLVLGVGRAVLDFIGQ